MNAVTGHYWSRNVYEVHEWALRWMREHQDLYDPERVRDSYMDDVQVSGWTTPEAREVESIADWCGTWIDNDPGDNGGDGFWRREYGRQGWRETYAEFRRLTGTGHA